VNVKGTLQLLESAREYDVKDIVYSSSAATCGEVRYTPIDETHPVEPDSPYGVTKLTGEKYMRCYSRLYGLNVVALRYFNVYGTNQYYDEYGNVIPIWTNRLINQEPLIIYGDGEQTRDFINVRDVARANQLAYEADVDDEVYAIGTGEVTEIKNLAKMILDVSGRSVPIEHEPPRNGEVRHSVADISSAEKDLEFEPTVALEEGLEEYVAWMEHQT
jgi:UDP-glucose 4-epimerase